MLVLLWRSLGPYHLARAAAAAARFAERGVRTVALELCDSEETRDWRVERNGSDFEVRTVAPGARLTDGLPSQAGPLAGMLDRLRPRYVAVAGYDRPEMRGALGWANRNGAVAVLMSETKWDDGGRSWWRRLIVSRYVRLADAGLVSGAAAGEYLVSLGMPREMIFRQYGAVDNDYFAECASAVRSRASWPRVPGHCYFVATCRLIEERKNLLRLLDAYTAYRGRVRVPWRLLICGEGRDRPLFEEHIERHGIEGVELTGFKQLRELADCYARAACFVHPAIHEAWGLVVNEAMAAGLPVLVSRRCGCAYDLVRDGVNGYTFDPYDVDDLANRMVQISCMSNHRLQEMALASQRIVAQFGTDAFARGLLSAVDAVVRRRTGRRRRMSPRLAYSVSAKQRTPAGP